MLFFIYLYKAFFKITNRIDLKQWCQFYCSADYNLMESNFFAANSLNIYFSKQQIQFLVKREANTK